MKQDIKIAIEPINDGDRLRLTLYEQWNGDDGKWSVRDIVEGPFRFVMNYAMKAFDPDTDLVIRKVHKR